MFLYPNFIEMNNHSIYLNLHHSSDHTLLTINISIDEEFIQKECWTIINDSEEEKMFIVNFIKKVGNLDTTDILNKDVLEHLVLIY